MAFEGSQNNALTIASADAFFKNFYINNKKIDALLYADDPFLMRLKRQPISQTVGGKKLIVPVRVGRSPSASKTFTEAQDQAKSRTGAREDWQLDIDSEYGVVRVSDKAIFASQTDKMAFYRMLRDEIDIAMKGVKQRLCTSLFASKANLAGTVSARSGSTVTLSLAHQVTAFDINDKIEFRNTSGTLLAGGTYYVTKVDRASRVMTLDKAVNSAVVNNSEVYRVGDYGQTAKLSLPIWLPKTLAGLGSLASVDRTLDPLRLAGSRKQMSASARFDDTIRSICAQIYMVTGENPTVALMNPLVEDLIAQEQRAQIRFDQASGKGAGDPIGAGIGGLAIKTARGMVEVVTSAFAPTDTIWILNEKDMAFFYLQGGDDAVFFRKTQAGGYFQMAHDAAGIEARIESFGNYALQNPGLHGRVDLDSSKIPSIT